MKRNVSPKLLAKSNKYIVKAIYAGANGSEIGRELHMSRERIGQIFFSETGISIRELLLQRSLKNKQKATKRYLIKCKGCPNKFLPTRYNRVFCSSLCRDKYDSSRRRLDITLQCDWCGDDYHPYYNYLYMKSQHHFCSKNCTCHYILKNLRHGKT